MSDIPIIKAVECLAYSFHAGNKVQARAITKFERAVDDHVKYVFLPAEERAYALCLEIEKLPSSEQQSKVSLMASQLRGELSCPPTIEKLYKEVK